MMRFVVSLTIQTLVFTVLLIGPAWLITGSLDWPRGWMTIGLLFASGAAGGLWLSITDPDLVRERTAAKPQSTADLLATLTIAMSLLAWLIFSVWDAVQLRLIALDPAITLWAGLALFATGLGVIIWTFRVNIFAATVVKVQSERRQRVIDTGPYALVRHPMYMGAILFCAGMALMLDSTLASLVAFPLFFLAFLPRMLVEEAALHSDLEGYADYQKRVRARIVPGLF